MKQNLLTVLLPLALIVGVAFPAVALTTVNLGAEATGKQIQAALDKLPAGGEVVLAPGKYVIHHPIILQHNSQTLRGSGPGTLLVLADKANCPVIILGSPTQSQKFLTSHLRLADLTIDGNRANQKVEFWRSAVDGAQLNNNGVDIWNVDDVTVENVTCGHCRSGGLVTAEVRHLTVTALIAFDSQFDGLACYQTEDSHFSKLYLHDNTCAGISIDLGFNHNTITDSILTGNELGVFMRESRDNTFKGLTISKSRKHGVFMAQSAVPSAKGWTLSAGTECTGNKFDGLTVNTSGGDAFLVNNSACIHNAITGARFADNVRGGLIDGDGKVSGTTVAYAEPVAPANSSTPVIQAVIMQNPAKMLSGH